MKVSAELVLLEALGKNLLFVCLLAAGGGGRSLAFLDL